jgi:DNA-binding response OmpR family regulator
MPVMNGFQLCEKLVDSDANIRVCFLSGGEMNQEAIREIYPRISLGCFIKKPVGANELIERVNSQLD